MHYFCLHYHDLIEKVSNTVIYLPPASLNLLCPLVLNHQSSARCGSICLRHLISDAAVWHCALVAFAHSTFIPGPLKRFILRDDHLHYSGWSKHIMTHTYLSSLPPFIFFTFFFLLLVLVTERCSLPYCACAYYCAHAQFRFFSRSGFCGSARAPGLAHARSPLPDAGRPCDHAWQHMFSWESGTL